MKSFVALLVTLLLGLAAHPTLAFEGGDILLRVGAITVDPSDEESDHENALLIIALFNF